MVHTYYLQFYIKKERSDTSSIIIYSLPHETSLSLSLSSEADRIGYVLYTLIIATQYSS